MRRLAASQENTTFALACARNVRTRAGMKIELLRLAAELSQIPVPETP
jgi:hypothetical protein